MGSSAHYPIDYWCRRCGAQGCKLWREYGRGSPLLCCECAAEIGGKQIGGIDAEGKYDWGDGHRAATIGFFVPAIPVELGSLPEGGRAPNVVGLRCRAGGVRRLVGSSSHTSRGALVIP